MKLQGIMRATLARPIQTSDGAVKVKAGEEVTLTLAADTLVSVLPLNRPGRVLAALSEIEGAEIRPHPALPEHRFLAVIRRADLLE